MATAKGFGFRGLVFIIKRRHRHGSRIRSTNVKSLWDTVMGHGITDLWITGRSILSFLVVGFIDEGSRNREVDENDGMGWIQAIIIYLEPQNAGLPLSRRMW